mgnify:FL=1
MPNDSAPWAQGYVSDMSYTDHFFREFAAAPLNYVAILNGCEPRPLSNGFTYCELGCGRGQTSVVLAAANPQGRFYACDFNPTHVAAARKLAEAGGVTNLTVLERNFEEMIAEPLPELDFVVLHGVWSWIGAANRRHIVDFIYRRVKPGGIVYVSYNAQPGWAATAPVRKMMQAVSEVTNGDSLTKAKAGLAMVKQLSGLKAKYLAANPIVERFVATLENQSPVYVAHEYLNENWDLFYSCDVARELAAAKLRFAGSATIVENHRQLILTKPMVEMLATLPSREMRELLFDFLINQRFRRDVFVRGGTPMQPALAQRHLNGTAYTLGRPAADVSFKGRGPLSEYAFDNAVSRALVAALAAGPLTLDALMTTPGLAGTPAAQVQQQLSLLVAAGQAAPCARSNPAVPAKIEGAKLRVPLSFNRHVLAESMDSPDHGTFASPLTGGGVTVDVVDRLFLQALLTKPGVDPAADIWSKFKARNIALKRDNKPIPGDEANLAELNRRYAEFRDKHLPFLAGQGIVEAA